MMAITDRDGKQLDLCILHVEHRAQQTWLDKLGEEVERSLRRRTTHDHVQRAFVRGNNSKKDINS